MTSYNIADTLENARNDDDNESEPTPPTDDDAFDEIELQNTNENNDDNILHDNVELSSIKDSDNDNERMLKLIELQNKERKGNDNNELSSIKDDDNDDARILKLIKKQENSNIKLFKINIQISTTETVTLKTECSQYTTIEGVKRIIVDELNKDNIDNIQLQYNNDKMDNNHTLLDYNITDSKHLIKLAYNVQKSNAFVDGFNSFKKFVSDVDMAIRQTNSQLTSNEINGISNNPNDGKISIILKMGSSTHIHRCFGNATISQIRTAAKNKYGLENCQLLFQGQILEDHKILRYYNIHGWDIIDVKQSGFDCRCHCNCCSSALCILISLCFIAIVIALSYFTIDTMAIVATKENWLTDTCKNDEGIPIEIYLLSVGIGKTGITIFLLAFWCICSTDAYDNDFVDTIFGKTFICFLWLFMFGTSWTGFIFIYSGSISDECLSTKSGTVLHIWVYYNIALSTIIIIAMIIDDIINEFKKWIPGLAISFILTIIAFDIINFMAVGFTWSQKVCSNLDNAFFGSPLSPYAALLIPGIAKWILMFCLCCQLSEWDNHSNPGSICVLIIHMITCFGFSFIGFIIIYAKWIPIICLNSKLGILLKMSPFYHLSLASLDILCCLCLW